MKHWLGSPGRLRRARGMTLAEMLIATAVVAIGILGTMASLWFGIRSERYSERRSNAVFQCRELLNVIRTYASLDSNLTLGSDLNDGKYDDDTDDNDINKPFNATPFENYFPNNPYNFRRRVELKKLATTGALKDIIAIKVTLFWDEGGDRKQLTIRGYK